MYGAFVIVFLVNIEIVFSAADSKAHIDHVYYPIDSNRE